MGDMLAKMRTEVLHALDDEVMGNILNWQYGSVLPCAQHKVASLCF